MVLLVTPAKNVFAITIKENWHADAPYRFVIEKQDHTITIDADFTPEVNAKPLRAEVFNWEIVNDPAKEDLPNNLLYLTPGMYDCEIFDGASKSLETLLIRVNNLNRVEYVSNTVEEKFTVYNG